MYEIESSRFSIFIFKILKRTISVKSSLSLSKLVYELLLKVQDCKICQLSLVNIGKLKQNQTDNFTDYQNLIYKKLRKLAFISTFYRKQENFTTKFQYLKLWSGSGCEFFKTNYGKFQF